MAWMVWLVRGDEITDLMSTWHLVDESLSVETPDESASYTAPSAAGSGVIRLGKTIGKRRISFRLVSSAQGMAALKLQYSQLLDFFEWARQASMNKMIEPCYLVIGDGNGYDKPPLYGAGCVWHQILDAVVNPASDAYSLGLVLPGRESLEVVVILDCLLGMGKVQGLANADGWVRFDDEGSVQVWEAFTNLIHNPSFEHATFGTDWTSSNAEMTAVVEYERVRTGFKSAKLPNIGASDRTWTVSLTLAANTYALSAYAYTNGEAVTSADLSLWAKDAAVTTTFAADTAHPGWYRMTGTFVGWPGAATYGVQVKAGKVVFLDDVQLIAMASAFNTLLTNGGFETAGGGVPDVWGTWAETAGDGALADEAALMHTQAHAAKATAGATANTLVAQSATVVASTSYTLTFYTRGDGTYAGRYAVYDVTNSADIKAITSTGVTGTTHTLVSYAFTTPVGCVEASIRLYCPADDTGIAYFDTVALNKNISSSLAPYPPFCLEGYKAGAGVLWAGTEHDSNQAVTAGRFRQKTAWTTQAGFEVLFAGKGAFTAWVNTPWTGDDGLEHDLLDTYVAANQNRIRVIKFTDNKLYLESWGSTAAGSKWLDVTLTSTIWPANTDIFIAATWDDTGPTALYIYSSGGSASDTVVGTAGTWTNLTNVGTFAYLGCSGAGANQWNGWLSDVRLFGPDATITPATMYAAGRGPSQLPFVLTDVSTANPMAIGNTQGDVNGTQTYNRFWIANLAGDLPAPIRLFLGYVTDHYRLYFSVNPDVPYPYTLNVVEAESYHASSGAAVGADTTRSANNRAEITCAAVGNSGYIICSIIDTPRLMRLCRGRWRLYAIINNAAAAAADFKFRASIMQNATSLASNLSYGTIVNNYYKYSVSVAKWEVVDMGVFSLPPSMISDMSYKQTRQALTEMSYPLGIYFDVVRTAGSGSKVLYVDCFVFMNEEFSWAAGTEGLGEFVCVDNISRPAVIFNALSTTPGDVHLEPRESGGMYGKPLYLPPHRWIFGNVLVADQAGQDPTDVANPQVQYQPVFLW